MKKICLLLFPLLLLTACDEPDLSNVKINIKSLDVNYTEVVIKGDISRTGYASVKSYGVCYSQSENPTLDDKVSANNLYNGESTYTQRITNLKENTTYYVRAYVTNGIETVYSECQQLKTSVAVAPSVSTLPVKDKSVTNATLCGRIDDTGGLTITEVGFYYSDVAATPTKYHNTISQQKSYTTSESFDITALGLQEATKYYYRAYAKNAKGITVGDVMTFYTEAITTPTVQTISVENITSSSARINIKVVDDGGTTLDEVGVCYASTKNPTTSNKKQYKSGGSETSYYFNLSLESDQLYHVRAYAKNSKGVSYGTDISFTTLPPGNRIFKVGDNTYVQFSPGNLQYQASTRSFQFAYAQYDIIGEDNTNISSSYSGWIDLFGYGTSGYTYKPYYSTSSASSYAQQDIYNTSHDWGVYASSDLGNGWRTLTSWEWVYLYENRANASRKRSRATVYGVAGFIFLPEEWELPTGCSFMSNASYYNTNNYDLSTWKKLENAGAVFLPAAGYRVVSEVSSVGSLGAYWSSHWSEGGTSKEGKAYPAQPDIFYFNDDVIYPSGIYTENRNNHNSYGHSVRLVKNVSTSTSKMPEKPHQKIIPQAINLDTRVE